MCAHLFVCRCVNMCVCVCVCMHVCSEMGVGVGGWVVRRGDGTTKSE